MTIIAGIDEAGRGPCFGPMVIAITVMKKEDEKEFKAHGVKDSKDLSAKQREHLEKEVKEKVLEYYLEEISPIQLNDLMVRYSLNEIEAMFIGKLIDSVSEKIDVIYVDSPDSVPGKFEKRIRKYTKTKTKIVAENKADSTYVVVSAASILAKVKRDDIIEKLRKRYGDLGSGYPSDEKTIIFLKKYVKEHSRLPPFSRIYWETCKKALNENAQQKLF